jgi:hypothetical protein
LVEFFDEVFSQVEPLLQQKASGLCFTVFFLVFCNELTIDILFLFNQMQYVRDILLEEFVFGVDLGLDLISESQLNKFIDLLIVELEVLSELF